ncbi:RluA family pseudouridine synthase [uncultured Parasphingopyxis sp.]|uniref:RluA family pseudouridine synthase n=1 Tax=uncultured Parasphingopyxis sp. TaxID=1547918 RepID=UPI00262C9AE0|nr:RluA family pseudouridine synthase [uncultured Parasphingopyxis sp.]
MSKAFSDEVREFTIAPDDDGIRLDRWFKRHLPDATFNIVSRWARTGQLRLDGKRAAPGDRIEAGQVVRVPPADPPKGAKQKQVRPPLSEDQIAFARSLDFHRDKSALVLNKPPGLAVQGGSKTKDHVDGLLDALQYEAEARPRLVHRLDKDTSGVLLVARSPRAASIFSKSFSSRRATKIYWAIITGVPDIDEGTIDLALSKQPGTGGEKMHPDPGGQSAKTLYRVIERAGNEAAFVALQPLTGRTHQLRVHMAAIGHPILGDGKYGGQDAFLTGEISRKLHLHARRLALPHPDGGMLDVTAELPDHFDKTMTALGFTASLGDVDVAPPDLPPDPAAQKRAARAYAKDIRKGRRGERRGRGKSRGGKG